MEKLVLPGVVVVVWLLSVWWYIPITQGMLKALGLTAARQTDPYKHKKAG